MKFGLALPQNGPLADPTAVRTVAVAAEEAGYEGLWVLDRLLAPLDPADPYPASADGLLPREMHVTLDPLGVLTLAAACTQRIGLGTNVLVAPWYPPVLLARSLTTLDRISGGRLTVGLGVGWSRDEYAAVGVPFERRGALLEETLDVFDAVWQREVVAYEGRRTRIVASTILPKPVQRPRPRVLLAAYSRNALERTARRADGWLPYLPPRDLAPMWAGLRETAERLGRDTQTLDLVVRAPARVTAQPLGTDRPAYCGSAAEVAADLAAVREAGAHELILELMGSARTAEEWLALAADLRERALGSSPRAA